MAERAYVFLDPDGSQGAGVVVVVQAPTGVIYASQVGGGANEERCVEGFAIPLFAPQHLAALVSFFGRYGGNPPSSEASCARWQDRNLQALAEIVGQMPLWHTSRTKDEPAFLEFDRARLPELTEGWIPVITPYGPGILMHQNGD
ncbi:DUF6210 family protein [Deinococcus ficus]|uniref:DUF6210 family protein n=1 Tax=Deinococcus ficus TaxID=317577 RepID=UPI000A0794BD|nr:DUF6210 family protein [Deinococcus ficus]